MGIRRKKKLCKNCELPRFIYAKGNCYSCDKKLNPDKYKVTQERKVTGEMEVFLSIWVNRPRECAVCEKKLYVMQARLFSHILPKSTYPKFRLYPMNILIKCYDCHYKWDFTPHSELRKDERWQPVFELQEKLKKDYLELEWRKGKKGEEPDNGGTNKENNGIINE